MRSRIILFIVGFFIWLMLGSTVDFQHVIVGVFVAGFVTLITGDLFSRSQSHFGHINRYFWFCYYAAVFLWECLKANIDVAKRVINPRLPINPGIVKVKTTLRSDTGLTFLANSITLTPGTFCIDIDRENGFLYIHWIDVRTTDVEPATRAIVTRFENILKKIFE